jgi:hypothetical protein
LPVIAQYDLLGFVTRADVLRFIEFKANLRPMEAEAAAS